MHNSAKEVSRTDSQNNVVIFPSTIEAARSVKMNPTSIQYYVRNPNRKYKGFFWSYLKNEIQNEFWIEHPIHEIECSDHGRVRLLRTGRILKGSASLKKSRHRYWVITLGYQKFYTHRLIAETFIENPEDKPTVDHIDRNPSNNRLDNLRWATHKEQSANTESKTYL